ncbi:MAG: hypothetical protein DMF49_04630 [Acidobacteria bacterium]|nr:MAG: hypothetical protein DMF49_04630 [Acidobacteriota bacterium]
MRLARGSVIVRAAKQHGGQLRVATADCLVSVEGTIFAVNSGTKGSRVSVLDGEVRVDRGRQRSVLHPGQQLSTSSSLAPVALDQEVAWSRDAADYLELLRRISALRAQLEKQIPAPPLRHSTRLLDLSPEGTVLYAAVPNLSEALSEGHRLLKSKIEQDELLEQWWRMSAGKDIEPELEEILEKLRAFGSHLGDEIVLTVQMDAQGRPEGPVVMAEVGRPEDLKLFLGDELRKASASAGPRLRLLPDPLPPASDAPAGAPSGNEILFWVHGDLFVATPSSRSLRRLAAGLDRPVPGGFASSLFCSRIAECYRDGVEYIVSADIERILHEALERGSNTAEVGSRVEALRRSGILDLQQVSLERKEEGGRSQDRLELSFDKPRRGLASWLAPPAPMGTLEFISPEAELAAVFVVKNPASLLEDLIGVAQAAHPDFPQLLSRFESERDVSIRHDFAAPLGGEFAFALDGPMLPVPSWKLVLEVYDPARLQRSVEWLVDQANGRSEAPGAAANLRLEREESAGRSFYLLRSANPPLEAHYTYAEGYLLAAPSRALLERAIQQKASHVTLTSAPSFMELLPRDGQVNFSAIVYQNLGSALGSLPKSWSGGLQALTPRQKRSIEAFELASSPSLLYAYGEQNRIVLASSGHGSLGPDLAALLGLGAFGLPAGEATERGR